MQLPKIGPVSGFQKIGTRDSSLPVAEFRARQAERGYETRQAVGEARTESAMWGGVANIAQNTVSAVQKFQANFRAKETKSQLGNYELRTKERSVDWDIKNRGRTEWGSDEVSPEIKAQLGLPDTDDPIADYLVGPAMKRAYQEKWRQEDSAMVTDPEARDAALLWSKELELKTYANGTKNAYMVQSAHQQAKSLKTISKYIQEEKFDLALEANAVAQFPPELKNKQDRLIMNTKQKNQLNSVVQEGTLGQVEATLELLTNDDPDTGSALTEEEDNMYINRLKAVRDSKKKEITNSGVAGMKVNTDKARQAISLWKSGSGQDIPIEERQQVWDAISSTDKNIALQIEYRDSEVFAQTLPHIMQTPDEGMSTEVKKILNKRYPKGGIYRERMKEWYDKAIAEGRQLRVTNPQEYADRFNLLVVEPFNIKDIPGSMVNRVKVSGFMDQQYDTGNVFFKKVERPGLGRSLTTGTINEQQGRIGQFHTSLGGDQNKLYDVFSEIGADSEAGTWTIAAMAQADSTGPRDTAGIEASRRMLYGEQLEAATKKAIFTTDVTEQINTHLAETMGGAYLGDKLFNQVKGAIYASYGAQASESHTEMGVYNEDWLKQAVTDATGGITMINDYQVPMPSRSTSTEDFDHWFTNQRPETFAGKIQADINVDELLSGMKTDYYPLEVSRNKYVIFNPVTRSAIRTIDNKPFYMRYDPTTPLMEPRPKSIWEESNLTEDYKTVIEGFGKIKKFFTPPKGPDTPEFREQLRKEWGN